MKHGQGAHGRRVIRQSGILLFNCHSSTRGVVAIISLCLEVVYKLYWMHEAFIFS